MKPTPSPPCPICGRKRATKNEQLVDPEYCPKWLTQVAEARDDCYKFAQDKKSNPALAYRRGVMARNEGFESDANPYPSRGGQSQERIKWFSGWHDRHFATKYGADYFKLRPDSVDDSPKQTGPPEKGDRGGDAHMSA